MKKTKLFCVGLCALAFAAALSASPAAACPDDKKTPPPPPPSGAPLAHVDVFV